MEPETIDVQVYCPGRRTYHLRLQTTKKRTIDDIYEALPDERGEFLTHDGGVIKTTTDLCNLRSEDRVVYLILDDKRFDPPSDLCVSTRAVPQAELAALFTGYGPVPRLLDQMVLYWLPPYARTNIDRNLQRKLLLARVGGYRTSLGRTISKLRDLRNQFEHVQFVKYHNIVSVTERLVQLRVVLADIQNIDTLLTPIDETIAVLTPTDVNRPGPIDPPTPVLIGWEGQLDDLRCRPERKMYKGATFMLLDGKHDGLVAAMTKFSGTTWYFTADNVRIVRAVTSRARLIAYAPVEDS